MAYFDRKDDINFIRWAKAVKIRDNFTCQICDRRGVELHAHHMNGWNWCVDERYEISNGITLCGSYENSCHSYFHEIYGSGYNTKDQFEEFKMLSAMLISVAEENILNKKLVKAIVQQCRDDGYLDGFTA